MRLSVNMRLPVEAAEAGEIVCSALLTHPWQSITGPYTSGRTALSALLR